MLTPILPAGGRRLVLAGLLAAVLAPPAAAGEATATMTVSARIVETCRVRLADPAPPPRARLPGEARDLIDHRCRHRQVRPRITASRAGERVAAREVSRAEGGNHVLITLTY